MNYHDKCIGFEAIFNNIPPFIIIAEGLLKKSHCISFAKAVLVVNSLQIVVFLFYNIDYESSGSGSSNKIGGKEKKYFFGY
jgi:hypothetical protein